MKRRRREIEKPGASVKRSRTRRPWLVDRIFEQSTESAKYRRQLFRSFRASRSLRDLTRGDAPHVVRRLPLVSYSAPLAQFRLFVQSPLKWLYTQVAMKRQRRE